VRVRASISTIAALAAAAAAGVAGAAAVTSGVPLARASGGARDVIVALRPAQESVAADVVGLARRVPARVRFVYSAALRGAALTVPASSLRRLAHDPAVAWVEPDRAVRADTTQVGPPWGLDRIDQASLPLDHAFHYTASGRGVTAYVIDTGVRLTHRELTGRVRSGYDAVDGGAAGDCNGHGTHVAATIAGRAHGVAKAVHVVAVRVLDCRGGGPISRVIAGIDWVIRTHAAGRPAVANLSLGGPPSRAVDTAVAHLVSDGVTTVVAAGNGDPWTGQGVDACSGSPGRVRSAVTVSATDRVDARASFADFGPCVDLFAPGVRIESAWNTSDTALRTLDGTSMAAPHVAGVAAIYLSVHPSAGPAAVASALRRAATVGAVRDARTTDARLVRDRW
jgi:subtilisin family serine protease